jgi:hypothetical protein
LPTDASCEAIALNVAFNCEVPSLGWWELKVA